MTSEKNLNISIDCVIFGFNEETNSLKVLLIERDTIIINATPLIALPGDLIYSDEDLPDAAERILKELTGLNGLYLKQFQSFGNPNRLKNKNDKDLLKNQRKHPEPRVVTIGYYSLVKLEDYKPTPSSFVKKAEWVDLDKVPTLAFDHNIILDYAINQLREDTINYNISFELLPKKFTLTQLQYLFEIILDKKLDKRNFRKTISKLVEIVPLGEKQTNVFHKPAQLYTFNKSLKK